MPAKVTMPSFCNDDMLAHEMSAASGADSAPLSHSFALIPQLDYLQVPSLLLLRTQPLATVELNQCRTPRPSKRGIHDSSREEKPEV